MFKRCIIALSLVCPPLFAHELTSFDAISKHLNEGKEIVSVLTTSKCEIDDPNPLKLPHNNITLTPSAVLFSDSLIAFDSVKFAHGHPPLPSNGLIQRGSFVLNNEGNATLTVVFFDASTNQKVSGLDDVKFLCQLGDGLHIFKR